MSRFTLRTLLKNLDDLISDRSYQAILIACIVGASKRYFLPEDLEAFSFKAELTTSKKAADVRQQELRDIVMKPLDIFYEEHLSDHLTDSKSALFREFMLALPLTADSERHADFVDELLRQLQKRATFADGTKGLVIGHPDTHRLIKDLIKAEADNHSNSIAKQLASVILHKKHDDILQSRAVWILIEYMKAPHLKKLVAKEYAAKKADIQKLEKSFKQAKKSTKGLEILLQSL